MYRTIITIRSDTPQELLTVIHETAAKAFHNRAGKLENIGKDIYTLIFEGDSGAYPCLELGTFAIKDSAGILDYISSWEWIDEDPDESFDMLRVFSAS
jgi:hypothetical protein